MDNSIDSNPRPRSPYQAKTELGKYKNRKTKFEMLWDTIMSELTIHESTADSTIPDLRERKNPEAAQTAPCTPALHQTSGPDPIEKTPLVSCVENATNTATQHFEATKIIGWIRADCPHFKLREAVADIRKEFWSVMATTNNDRKQARSAIAELKKRLPGALLSGTFRTRKKGMLLEHSGLLCADLDELGDKIADVRQKLVESPHSWAVFLSPTGDGLKCVLRVAADAEKHEASFRAVEHHVRMLTGIQIDEKCKDLGRLCFLSHDAGAYLNEKASELPLLPNPEHVEKAVPLAVANKKLKARRNIAAELLGEILDRDGRSFCTCPGQHLHTAGDVDTDCQVFLAEVATVFCFHNSCREVVEETNHNLRSRIAKAERLTPVEWFNQKFPALSRRFGHAIEIRFEQERGWYVADIAEDFLAATLAEESSPDLPTIFVPIEQKFYTYDPAEGLYVPRRDPDLLTKLSQLLL